MAEEIAWSRPWRWASEVGRLDEAQMRHYVRKARVAIRVESQLESDDSRQSLLLAVNMLLRFCPHVVVVLPTADTALARLLSRLGGFVLQSDDAVEIRTEEPPWDSFDATITVGRIPLPIERTVTINSSGWVARISADRGSTLPWRPGRPNAIGALAAACLGVGEAAMTLLKVPHPTLPHELSLYDYSMGELGSLDYGPELPRRRLEFHGLLFGCGAVSNGWTYALHRLPVKGTLDAVDKQSVAKENLGPYILVGWPWIGKPKALLVARSLEPAIQVTPRPELLEFYKIRIDQGLVKVPSLVVAGLDAIPPRHIVQRLWPDVLIDMASGGTTTQLVVHHAGAESACLLEALVPPATVKDFAEVMAGATGLAVDRIRNNPTDYITEEDVLAAPPQHRAALDDARRNHRLICGRVTDHNLHEEGYSDDFAPAVPFVSAFSGVTGAAATMRTLMNASMAGHYQFDFRTMRGRRLHLVHSGDCQCANVGATTNLSYPRVGETKGDLKAGF